MSKTRLPCLALLLVIAAGTHGCGGAIGSGDISITVNSMNQSDVSAQGMLEKDENISNGTGNPWGEFITRARQACGRDPAGLEVVSAFANLASGSARAMEDVFSGPVTLFFRSTRGSDSTAISVDVATATAPRGAGPIALRVAATRTDLTPLIDRLVGGDFHVGVRGTSDATGDFSIDVRVTFSAIAHCR